MNRFALILFGMMMTVPAFAEHYHYTFKETPVAKALSTLVKEHPDANITFIYNELDDYTTSASINTDNLKSAVKDIVARNPITVSEKKGRILVEALQKGKFRYSGKLLNEYNEPVAHATVLLLNPKDSVVLTFGITSKDGAFLIPCDRNPVIAKISSTGYKTRFLNFDQTSLGNLLIDTTPIELDNIEILADNTLLEPDRTVFVPMQRQKNTSMSGLELLEQIGIPQLIISPDGELTTVANKPVKIFIDFLPVQNSELSDMNLQDVKRIEYLEAPADPRFMGEKFVINFIMEKYLYGGYVKAAGYEVLNIDDREFSANFRYQYKRMTYDLAGYGAYSDSYHNGTTSTEVFRFPQENGEIKTIERLSTSLSSRNKSEKGRLSFKATYSSDNITARSTISGGINDTPINNQEGEISYSPEEFPSSNFTSEAASKAKFIRFNGSYYFRLPKEVSLSFSPTYNFSHTTNNSLYNEISFDPVYNSANDKTSNLSGYLNLNRSLNKGGSLSIYLSGNYDYYRTDYSGSAQNNDKTEYQRYTTGINYSFQTGGFYGEADFGWIWDTNCINAFKSRTSTPKAELSLSYLFKKRHRLNFNFDYTNWAPDASFKSQAMIQSNHLLSYTGNPELKPSPHYTLALAYSWIPSRKGYIQAYGNIWKILDRYVYDYEPSGNKMIRYIRQPMGDYHIIQYGLSGRLSLFDSNLVINGSIYNYIARNGRPYSYTHSELFYYIRATYWLNNFYFSGYYSAPSNYSDGFMVGDLYVDKSTYHLTVGWANKNWNIRFWARNFARWDWMSHKQWFKSKYYDHSFLSFDPSRHANLNITVTYTFNYGKKQRDVDELETSNSTSSAILRN